MIQAALFLTAILSLLFALVIFINDARSILFKFYLTFGVFSALWMSANAVVVGGSFQLPLDIRFHFAQLITPLALATSLSFYLFLRYFTRQSLGHVSVFLIALSALVSLFAFTNFNVYVDNSNQIALGSLYPFYLIAVVLNIFFIFHSLYSKHTSNRNTRMQLRYLKLGAITSVIPTLAFGAVLPIFSNSELSSIGPLFSIAFLFFAGIAIVKHRLFDIKLAAVRAVAYAFSILVLASIYYFLAYILSITLFGGEIASEVSLSPINIIIALILAFVFQPIKRFFDRVTDSIFYRDNYKSEDFFATLSDLLSSTIDLRGLLERASREISSTFKSEQTFFVLYYSNGTTHHMTAGTKGHSKLPMYDARMLDEYIATTTKSIFMTDQVHDAEPTRRMLRSHKIALVMPLRLGDKIAGYLFLGEHLSSNYSKRDVSVLSTISNELVIAIQNALSLHELKELNATLQQRIDVATKELRSSNAQLKHLDEVKDEFMSMASHQLRTPLTSVKGYLSMVLEEDVDKVTPKQRKMLQEAFNSSERMVRLIADFLNVSRLQTGKFTIEKVPVDIKSVIKQELGELELLATSHGIKLRLAMTDKPLPVIADESKIRQVVMNFVDNAIYYSPSSSTIVIKVEKVKDSVALTVVDSGIGVPEDEQAKLFTKFFRAKNARKQRPDGTGVGLYLARRVISAHNGALIFSSREGKGSTFGFRIPLDKRHLESKK